MAKKILKPQNKKVLPETPPEVPSEARSLSQIERLAKLGTDYGNIFNQDSAKGLYAYFGSLTTAELMAKLKSPNVTQIEKSIIVHISKMNASGKDAMGAIEYFHERIFGKVESTTKTQISGANGGAIKVETDIKGDFEKKVATMTNEQLEALEKQLNSISVVLGQGNGTKES